MSRDADIPNDLHRSIGTHEVFISHRGIAMKRGFANHLYHYLKQRGIKAFLDKEELPEGHDVRPFMLQAARKAIIQVPIFSRTYAESTWCLDELVEMMGSTKSSSKAKVFPVFYDLKSEELRKEDGPCAKAIKVHRQEGKRNQDTIKGWEAALRDASWLEGFRLESYNGFEGDLAQDLVAKIAEEMQYRQAVVEEEGQHEVLGLEKRVHDVLELFHLEEKTKVFFVLLWGMGGIGKTTLAGAIHQRLRNQFQATSFVKNYGDKKPGDILSDLLDRLLHEKNANDPPSARERLKRGLEEKKCLIILDDVKNFDSIKEILDVPTSLERGSRILVTSRNQRAFPHESDFSEFFRGELYNVQGMDCDASLRLLCLHAFNKPSPAPGFEELAKRVSESCGGLPLSLKVLGSHLSTAKENEFWEEAIDMLKSNAYEDIGKTLMISYDALRKHEKEMFLDTACFLIGQRKQDAEYFWDGLVVGWRSGLKRLVELCLVKVEKHHGVMRLTMHDHLRDLGRGIVAKKYKKSGKCSRVWDNTDLLSQVFQSKQGLDQIRGLATSRSYLDAGLLSRMRSLRLLFLDHTCVDGDVKGLEGLQIKWIKWLNGYPPKELGLDSLTVLELDLPVILVDPIEQMRKSDAVRQNYNHEFPFSCGQLKKLRKLDMHKSSFWLEELPEDFGSLESLEELDLSSLKEITELPSSFGQLKKLQKLDLNWCDLLKELPEDFGSLESLEELYAEWSGITKLPSSFGQLKKLRKLDLNQSGITKLPSSFGSLESLEEFYAEWSRITKLPSSFGQLKKLRKLDLNRCELLEELPEDFGSLESLEELYATCSRITKLPSSFGQLKKLRKLDLDWCELLKELPEDFGSLESLEELYATYSRITKLPSSFGQLKKLRKLDLDWCELLKELPEDFGSLESLEELHAGWSGISRLPASFWQLKKLNFGDCNLLSLRI